MSKSINRSVAREEVPPPRRKVVWRWLLVLAYAVCIFVVSAVPGHALPKFDISDKLLHATEFGVLAFLLCRALHAQTPTRSPYFVGIMSILATIGYGATDEVHQLLVAQRMTDLADLAADSLGALLAAWGWFGVGTRCPWLR